MLGHAYSDEKIVALLGTLITADDDAPGGWSNPDGTVRSPWRRSEFWADMTFRGALASSAFAIGAGWTTREAVVFWFLCLAATVSSFGLLKWAFRNHPPNHDKPPNGSTFK